MTATNVFPVLNHQNRRPSEMKAMPRSVPWTFAEQFREQAEYNHGQTLERLAERGGLSPEEMYVAAHKLKPAAYRDQTLEDTAIAWLNEELK